MAGQPKTRAAKALREQRAAERAVQGRKVRNPRSTASKDRKKAEADEAKARGEELDWCGYTRERWAAWMKSFAEHGRQDLACKAADIPRQTVYDRIQGDALFKEFTTKVREMVMDSLEDEAIRRARDGWDEPQFWKGELQGYVTKYDSSLLQFLLIHGRPEKYRPKKEQELTFAASGTAPTINLTVNRPGEK